MLYSIEPSAVKEVRYCAGQTVTIRLTCGKSIIFHSLAMNDDEVYGSRETPFECTCDEPCPARLVEKGEES